MMYQTLEQSQIKFFFKFLGFNAFSQNWKSETSWLFKKMKRAYQTYMKNV